MVAYLKASAHEKTYFDYLRAAREAEKEEVMELSHNQMDNKPSKPMATSFLPLQKLKGTQPTKILAVRGVHLEEEGSKEEVGTESQDLDGIDSMMEEFIVHLARAVKETQEDKKHCYHCSSMEQFICKCPLVRASRSAAHLNQKEGTALEKGYQAPQVKAAKLKVPQEGMPKAQNVSNRLPS